MGLLTGTGGRLVLEVEILPRFTLRQGVPFVVSAVTRYLLVTAGVLVAMAAIGIDLTKVTLLAGALGVTRLHLLLLGGGLLLLGRISGP
jgi:small-conductance mechanosensitive channel